MLPSTVRATARRQFRNEGLLRPRRSGSGSSSSTITLPTSHHYLHTSASRATYYTQEQHQQLQHQQQSRDENKNKTKTKDKDFFKNIQHRTTPRSPRIFPGSLQRTLEEHRDINRANLIRRVPSQKADKPLPSDGREAVRDGWEDKGSDDPERWKRKRRKVDPGITHRRDSVETYGRSAGGGARVEEEEEGEGGEEEIGDDKHFDDDNNNDDAQAQHPSQEPSGKIAHYSEGERQHPKGEWSMWGNEYADAIVKPWLTHMDAGWGRQTEYVHDYITAEILAFEKYMSLTAEEEAALDNAFKQAKKVMATVVAERNITLIGSRSTGLAMPLSDMDVNIEPPAKDGSGLDGPASREDGITHPPPPASSSPTSKKGQEARENTLNLLATVRKRLRKKGGPKPLFTNTMVVKAKVPIVRVTHVPTKIEIQVQSSTMASLASTELVKSYLSEFPTLRPLFLVLRQTLKMRSLGDPQDHGIGSYPLVMMIVATLKFSGARFDRRDAGRHLLYFLDFYTSIDFSTTGISVDPPELFARRAATATATTPGPVNARIRHSLAPDSSDQIVHDDDAAVDVSVGRKRINYLSTKHPYLMCLQDPANPYNDLGLQAQAIKHVQATLKSVRARIYKHAGLFRDRDMATHQQFSVLKGALMADYRSYQRRREALHIAGMKHVKGSRESPRMSSEATGVLN